MNLKSFNKRIKFVLPPSTKVEEVAKYVEDFDRVLATMGCNENDLLAALDKNWEPWRPSFNKR